MPRETAGTLSSDGASPQKTHRRTASVSVVIPARNEEAWIAGAVASAFAAGASEVLVADAGSSDETSSRASGAGARVLSCSAHRARQLNEAVRSSTGEALIFLHADTRLPPGAAAKVAETLESGAVFGGFRIAFLEPVRRLRIAAAMINFRTSLTRCPWGDQAQFIRRETFLRMGGFREIALMEDYDLALRMKREGKTVVLPEAVATSGRRFLVKGLLRTAAINWSIIIRFRLGADPDQLARWYRS